MINIDQNQSYLEHTDSYVKPEETQRPSGASEVAPIIPPTPHVPQKKSAMPKVLLAVIGLLIFVGIAASAVLISQKQMADQSPVAPNAPESKPKAYVEKPASCTLTFNVPNPSVTPSPTPTEGPSPTPTEGPSPTPTDGPSVTPSATPTDGPSPTPTEGPSVTPTEEPSATPTQEPSLTPTEGPSATPTEGPSATPTEVPSATPTNTIVYVTSTPEPTLPPGVTPNPTTPSQPITYTIVTTYSCNDSCTKNSDCENASHICYGADSSGNGGRCRLDANPESPDCKLQNGQTVAVVRVIPTHKPDMPVELPRTGPEDWAKYLKVGLGALGIGALLLLFL